MQKYQKQILYTLTIIMFLIFVVALSPKAMQNDTFWSIKVGEKILNEGFDKLDNFSIHENLNYVAHHYLTDILIYVIYTIGGFLGLYIFEIVLTVIMAGLLFILNNEVTKSKIASIAFLTFQMIILSGYIAVRAQMISFILFILELILLEKFRQKENTKYLVGLCLIPLLLANFHMGVVPFYFIIIFVNIIGYIKFNFLCFETVEKTDRSRIEKLLLTAIVGILVIFINPYFVDGVVYPYKTFGNEFINSTIQEFQPFRINFDGGMTMIYMAVIFLLIVINKSKIKLQDILLILGTWFMSFMAIRYVSLFVICSYVVLRYTKEYRKYFTDSSVLKALKGTMYIVLIVIYIIFGIDRIVVNKTEYIPKEAYPVKAIQVLKEITNEETRIFNEYAWGSLLMLNDIKVYIDSRCDLYTEEYNNVTIATDYNKLRECDRDYKEVIDKYDLNTFFISPNEKIVTLLSIDNDYKCIYEDETAVIFVAVK